MDSMGTTEITETTEFTQLFSRVKSSLLQDYGVPDFIQPDSTFIFILESPHLQELKYGVPVAGPSGATMSKHLFGEKYAKFPLGLLVKKNADEAKNRPRLNRIGLMNVSNIPLQSAAYGHPEVRKTYAPWFDALARIRSSNHQDEYKDALLNAIQAVMVESLREKLFKLADKDLAIIPCGRFAQKFFRLANVTKPNWHVIRDVPHPSYNSWDRAQYTSVIGQVKQAFASLNALNPINIE